MAVYKFNRLLIRILSGVFSLLSILSFLLFEFGGGIVPLILAAVFILFALGCVVVPSPEIVTNPENIKINRMGRLYQECHWDWISEVKTRRSSAGTYTTFLEYSNLNRNKSYEKNPLLVVSPKEGVVAVSADFDGYVLLLREIKQKAISAQFDEATENILKNGVHMSKIRKGGWILAILFFIGLLIYFGLSIIGVEG